MLTHRQDGLLLQVGDVDGRLVLQLEAAQQRVGQRALGGRLAARLQRQRHGRGRAYTDFRLTCRHYVSWGGILLTYFEVYT